MSKQQPAPTYPSLGHLRAASPCPHWCAIRHDAYAGEEDLLHIGRPLMVEHTALRLASSIDPETGIPDGPVVLIGEEEFTLYQAEALIDALSRLIGQGARRIP